MVARGNLYACPMHAFACAPTLAFACALTCAFVHALTHAFAHALMCALPVYDWLRLPMTANQIIGF